VFPAHPVVPATAPAALAPTSISLGMPATRPA
jgi:hypothetical protein